jgi:hypothetical protein
VDGAWAGSEEAAAAAALIDGPASAVERVAAFSSGTEPGAGLASEEVLPGAAAGSPASVAGAGRPSAPITTGESTAEGRGATVDDEAKTADGSSALPPAIGAASASAVTAALATVPNVSLKVRLCRVRRVRRPYRVSLPRSRSTGAGPAGRWCTETSRGRSRIVIE